MATNANVGEPPKKKKRPELPIVTIKNTSDYQKMKLDRLMANIDKPVTIPVKRGEKNLPPPPDFVRNIMGSSAGAGSGEFHVYRHLRRKEYARQKTILEQAKFEEQEAEFARKVAEKQKLADEKTAKKREKRLKKKAARMRNKGKQAAKPKQSSSSSNSESEEEKDSQPGEAKDAQKPDDPVAKNSATGSESSKNLECPQAANAPSVPVVSDSVEDQADNSSTLTAPTASETGGQPDKSEETAVQSSE